MQELSVFFKRSFTFKLIPLCILPLMSFGQVKKSDETLSLFAEELKPTQFSIGLVPAMKKKKKIEKYYKNGTLLNILKQKVLPVVIGPKKGVYILDGHHTSYALLKSEIPDSEKKVFIRVVKDCSQCSTEEFTKVMNEEGFSFLYDKNFVKKKFSELPASIDLLEDNPYRSLSWLVRKKECFTKTPVNFIEFTWGKILKEELDSMGINLSFSHKEGLKALIKVSCKIVKKETYKDISGWNGERLIKVE